MAVRTASFALVGALLVLNLTDAYRVVSLVFGLSGATLVALMTAIMLLFLLVNSRTTADAIRYKPIISIVVLLGAWPLFTATYTVGESTRAVGILIHNLLLLLTSFILFTKASRKSAKAIFISALAISAAGVMSSLVIPVAFIPLAIEAGAALEYEGRAFGLFLQPNTLGLSICFLMLCLNCTFQRQTVLGNAPWVIIFVALILATGSRFSMVVMALIIIFVLMRGTTSSEVRRVSYLTAAKAAFALPLVWLGAVLMFYALGLDQLAADGNAADRIRSMLQFEFFHSADDDGQGSLSERREAQNNYFELIGNSPLLGYGIGSQATLLEAGTVPVAAHSSILSYAFEYGVPYVIVLVVTTSYMLWTRTRRPTHSYRLKLIRLLFFCFLISFTVNHGAIENRFFYVALGFGLSVVYLTRPAPNRRSPRLQRVRDRSAALVLGHEQRA